jgi:hypothetical protein
VFDFLGIEVLKRLGGSTEDSVIATILKPESERRENIVPS